MKCGVLASKTVGMRRLGVVRAPARWRRIGRLVVVGALAAAVCLPATVAQAGGVTAAHAGKRHLDLVLAEHRAAPRGMSGLSPRVSRSPAAIVNKITGPALVFTDSNATGPFPNAQDLSTGGNLRLNVGIPSGCSIEPRLDPSGHTDVFVHFADPTHCSGTSELRLISTLSGFTTLLTAPAHAFFELPNWSPDGSTILYTLVQDDSLGNFLSSQLYTIPAAGGAAPTAIGGAGVMGYDGVYSPDGTKIALAPALNDPNVLYLGIMNVDGSGLVPLTSTALTAGWQPDLPAWSPDGQRLSFSYAKTPADNTNWGIGVVNVNDTGVRKLGSAAAAGLDAFTSTWSADSSEIYFDGQSHNPKTDAFGPGTIYATNQSGGYRTTVIAGNDNDWMFDPFFVGPGPSTGSESTFTAVTPARVQQRVSVGPNGSLDVQVAGGASPVPAGATAVTLNLTGVSATAPTYLQVFPAPASGNAKPLVSNLNLAGGQTAAVAVQVSVPTTGAKAGFVRIYNKAGTVGVIVDVDGYFTADTTHAGFVPLSQPTRVLDQTIAGPGSHDVTLTGVPGRPANAVAVVLNLTAAGPTAGTYESVVPTPLVGTPAVSNLNLAAGQTRANLVTVPIGTSGQITVFNSAGSVRTIADVVGFYTSDPGHLGYYPLAPTRVLDTRSGTNTANGSTAPIGPGRFIDLPVVGTTTTQAGTIAVPAGAQVAVLSVTAVNPTASTYLTVYATGLTTPLASNINAAKGTVVPNLVLTALGTAGRARIFNKVGDTAVLADLAGYYAP